MLSSVPDFTHRVAPADLPEWLDEPRSYEELQPYMGCLEQVNTFTLGARPTLNWLEPLVQRGDGQPLRIVDVGCGGGDMLRRVERWAARRGIAVQLTGIDLNPQIIQLARDWSPKDSRIMWITGDAFAYTGPIDIVLSALLTHHLPEPGIVHLLAWMESTALRGWYINDLVREPNPYKLFTVISKLLFWHPMVQQDGPVSFRRAFREEDWLRMLAAAHIDPAHTTMRRWTPGRLCLGRVK